MSRYLGPKAKLSRRLGISVTEGEWELKGNKVLERKSNVVRTKKASDYSIHLKEKQRVRFVYGLSEKQFHKTFLEAGKMSGVHGENFLFLLESRLDNLVYRLGFATTRPAARQLVNHGHIQVDGKKIDIASVRLKPGQTISLRESSKNLKIINDSLDKVTLRKEFVSYDPIKKRGVFVRYPQRNEILPNIKEQLIVEFYSK